MQTARVRQYAAFMTPHLEDDLENARKQKYLCWVQSTGTELSWRWVWSERDCYKLGEVVNTFHADSIQTQTPHWLCNMSFIFSFCREICGVEWGPSKKYIFWLSEKSLMDGVRHFQCFSIVQWSSVNWTPGANISQLCSHNLSPDRTHSISQPQPQPGQSYIGDIQTTYYATNWNLSQNNQDSKYTGREKENTQRQTERDLFCSKLTQTIKIQNQATVTSQEIFVKSKEI